MFNKIAVKIGTNVITNSKGILSEEKIEDLVGQIVQLKKEGKEIVLISSGAVAAGKQKISKPRPNDPVSRRQLWSAMGQVELINVYNRYLQEHGISCAQVLVTKNDFRDRQHYLNMKNCISTLLNNNIIPIVNENDAISITELMFTDNDELAGLIASMANSDSLIILSNVDGIYDGSPSNPESKVIPIIDESYRNLEKYISTDKSNFGRGGMVTKCDIARKVASAGITVFVANGLEDDILTRIVKDYSRVTCTKFVAGKKKSNIKKWIAHSEGFEKGKVFINEGARKALESDRATSLLFVGVVKIEGNFKKGDIVKIFNEEGKFIGLGRARYHSGSARELVGQENRKPLVHYDYLYLENGKK
jgi:glutamate 5-kinase